MADSDTKTVNENDISFSEGLKMEIVNMIVVDIRNYRSQDPLPPINLIDSKILTLIICCKVYRIRCFLDGILLLNLFKLSNKTILKI